LDRVAAWVRMKAANSCGEFEKAGSMPALSIFWPELPVGQHRLDWQR